MKTKPMNPDVKAKWLEALRSGEYKQAEGVLRTRDDGYCCLGVLCQIASDEGVVPQPEQLPHAGNYHWTGSNGVTGYMYLIPAVMEWAGIDSHTGVIETGDNYLSLSQMNDDGATFEAIADVIEQNL